MSAAAREGFAGRSPERPRPPLSMNRFHRRGTLSATSQAPTCAVYSAKGPDSSDRCVLPSSARRTNAVASLLPSTDASVCLQRSKCAAVTMAQFSTVTDTVSVQLVLSLTGDGNHGFRQPSL